jgi:NAD(P)-dependent dehydrogenase (short-subunit alcohol dehydrogenase family)
MAFDDYFDMEPDEYLSFFKVHDLGHYILMQAVVPYMKEAGLGRIVNVTSVTGVNGGYSSPAYTASKAGAICQTKAFARKFGEFNITVNSVAPGMVKHTHEEEFAAGGVCHGGEYDAPAPGGGAGGHRKGLHVLCQEKLFVSGKNLIVDGGSNL